MTERIAARQKLIHELEGELAGAQRQVAETRLKLGSESRRADQAERRLGEESTRLEEAESRAADAIRSEEHTSELQSPMRISYAVSRLQKKNRTIIQHAT